MGLHGNQHEAVWQSIDLRSSSGSCVGPVCMFGEQCAGPEQDKQGAFFAWMIRQREWDVRSRIAALTSAWRPLA